MEQVGYIVFYIVTISAGALVGGKLIAPAIRKRQRQASDAASGSPLVRIISIFQFIAILFIVFLMGLRIGADRRVFDSLGSIGVTALVITVFSIGFSVLFVFFLRKMAGFDREGVRHGHGSKHKDVKS